ncbi:MULTISPECIES: hypothetical protein [Methylobacterium]|uniref:hypothetical protein n=1 Tax=Methylobacterium TaxID=407 RepID=UPI0013EAA545|nr:hypothetical protein [Methylobacterium sp. DB0501]NGM35465.1 hypothetical protein [Methylobacterium sp. DB0501]
MIPVEIDPSEVRRPRGDSPERASPRLGRPAMLAGLAVIGIGGCAGLAAAAYPAISDMLRPRPTEVHFGRVADMPEIKDGIPALRTNPPPVVRQVAIPPANPTATASSPPAVPAALLDPKPSSGAQGMSSQTGPVQGASVQGNWSPASDVAATGTAGSFQTIPAAIPKAPETPRPVAATPREGNVSREGTVPREAVKTREASTPREDVKSREAVKPRLAATPPREATPLPPARAVQAGPPVSKPTAPREKVAEEKPSKPAPAREAKVVEPPKPSAHKAAAEKPVARREKPDAHQRTAAAQADPARAAPAPQAEEPTRFLGVPMPDLAPAGRAIKDTVDAVISFPSRL